MYILDTDHLGILQRRRGHEFDQLVQKIAAIGDVNVYVTIVSFHEIVSGWTKFVKQSQDSQKVVTGYARLQKILIDFSVSQVLPFSLAAAEVFEEIKRQKIRIATMDLRIAAIALSRQMTVVTRNAVDFEKIPGLPIEDWTN